MDLHKLAGKISEDIAKLYMKLFIQKTRFIDPELMDVLEFRIQLHREICEHIKHYYYC